MTPPDADPTPHDRPPHAYTPALAQRIERRWQRRWADAGTFHAANPTGPLSTGFDAVAEHDPFYILDMFPYPSGDTLHVGHPLGFVATDVYARYLRMRGRHVLHAMGFDAFGLPAEQHAIETGEHPATVIDRNVATMRRQLDRLGLGHDPRRQVRTTDPSFYRWTQWIFTRLFGSWHDPTVGRTRPIAELIDEFERGVREPKAGPAPTDPPTVRPPAGPDPNPQRRPWSELDETARRRVVDTYRLAYRVEAPVNWCPALGTVLANEEVTAAGRSERGDHPVHRRMMTQWMLRITDHADRLLAGLDDLDWPDHIVAMQRNWIGRSEGAVVRFAVVGGGDHDIATFTTRVDTLPGVVALAVGPDHELAAGRPHGTRLDVVARHPLTGDELPVHVADHVVGEHGTGAVMVVPAHDERDAAFAAEIGLPAPAATIPPDEAVAALERDQRGHRAVAYRLRDWLFSRQRYWGEPFPIVYDEHGLPHAVPADQLPVTLPELDDFAPRPASADSDPQPPLARATDWTVVTLDLGDGPRTYRRETNTMPQWAGSSWYHLRYLDPGNDERPVDPEVERYWMGDGRRPGGVDLYVGGVEHAVLHLLYARFWHQVLHDLGHVCTPEPFQRLYNQGYVLADAYVDDRGVYVPADEVEHDEVDGPSWRGRPVEARAGKMGKSLKNSVPPDDVIADHGVDTLRLYLMASGPLDADRPWRPDDIVGMHRFLKRLWRAVIDEHTGEPRVDEAPADEELRRALHRTVDAVRADIDRLKFNTAIAALVTLTNEVAAAVRDRGTCPRDIAEPLVLLVAPFAPHVAEELWERLGHTRSLAHEDYPEADPTLVAVERIDVPVQIDGTVRSVVTVDADADREQLLAAALADERIVDRLAGREVADVIVVRGRVVNVVTR